LDEALARAGVITPHIPATPATPHFISEQASR